MFNQPQSSSGYFKPAEHADHLVLITTVHSSERKFDQLRKEELDEFVVDFVDIDDAEGLRERVTISHKGITSRLTVGATMILGRIGQVDTKSGFQAWALLPFTEGSDDVRAEQWVTANRAPTFNQAAPAPAPAPTTDPWATATPAPAPAGLTPQQYAAAQQDPATRALLAQQAQQTAPAAGGAPPF